MHSSIFGVTMNTAQLPQRIVIAVSTGTSHCAAIFSKKSPGSIGFAGPYMAVSMAFCRFLRLTPMSCVARGHASPLVVSSVPSSSA